MEKKQPQPKEKIIPWSYRTTLAIWMIVFGLATILAADQKSPWLLIYTIIIGVPLGVLILVGGIRAAGKLPPKPAERTPRAFMKKCVKCGIEIPIASEECPSCGSKQP